MKTTAIALLAAALSLQANADVQLLPAAEFAGRDGRPGKGLTWKITDAQGRALASRLTARHSSVNFNFDYEHQAILSEKNGQPAPASGWAQRFEWRDGVGLFAVDVKWTDRARQMIEAGEYRYISPVIVFDKVSLLVLDVLNASLTNIPNLDLSPVAQERLERLGASFFNLEPSPMNELLNALLKALGLPESVSEQDATAAVTALKAKADKADTLSNEVTALKAKADTAEAEVASLKAKKDGEFDPTRFVTLDKFNEVQTQLAALQASGADRQVDELIAQAKSDGKLVPAAEEVWRNVGKASVAQLRALIEKTPANPALAGLSQTKGREVPTDVAQLSAEQKAICLRLGVSEADFLETLKRQAGSAVAA